MKQPNTLPIDPKTPEPVGSPATCSAVRPAMWKLQSMAAVARRRFNAGNWSQRETIDMLEKQMKALAAQPNVELSCEGEQHEK